MPITKSAIKKLRQDKLKRVRNKTIKERVKNSLVLATKNKSEEAVHKATSVLDKAAKVGIISKNKAAREKSKLDSLLKKQKVKVKKPRRVAKSKKT